MRTTLAAALITAAALPLAAHAAPDVPGDGTTEAVLVRGRPNPGVADFPRDVDWYRVGLKAGINLGFAVVPTSGHVGPQSLVIDVRDHDGDVLATSDLGFTRLNGVEYEPATGGPYLVGVRDLDSFHGYPGTYDVIVTTDCRDDPGTDCAIAVGQTQRRGMNWGSDIDDFRTRLRRGVRYVAKARADRRQGIDLFLKDAKGRYVAQGDQPFAFTVPRDGTYYLSASAVSGPEPFKYTLSLKKAR